MAWALLVLGGLFEIGFTTCLRFVDDFRNLPWTLGFLVSVALSMSLLQIASRSIPMGTAYAVWGGIGALGTVLVGSPGSRAARPGAPAADLRPGRLHRRAEAGRGMSVDPGLLAWVEEAWSRSAG